MLADHALRLLVGDAVVVIGHRRPGRDEHIADAIADIGVHVGAEQAGVDRLLACHHPRARLLGFTPARGDGRGAAVRRVELQHSRLAGHQGHIMQQRVPVAQQHVPMRRHVDHSMIRRDERADARREHRFEPTKVRVEFLQPPQPSLGFPAVRVTEGVEFRYVDVNERARVRRRACGGGGEALGRGRGADELGSALDRPREAAVAIQALAHHERGPTGVRLPFQQRLRALPGHRVEPVGLPPLELVGGDIGSRDAGAVSDDAVGAGIGRGEKPGEGGGRRRGERAARGILLRHRRRQETCVSGTSGEIAAPESVDQDQDRRPGRDEPVTGVGQ